MGYVNGGGMCSRVPRRGDTHQVGLSIVKNTATVNIYHLVPYLFECLVTFITSEKNLAHVPTLTNTGFRLTDTQLLSNHVQYENDDVVCCRFHNVVDQMLSLAEDLHDGRCLIGNRDMGGF